MAVSQTDTHIWVLPLLQGCSSVVGTWLENILLATGSLQVLPHKVKRLLLKQLPPGKLGDNHACAFELSSV